MAACRFSIPLQRFASLSPKPAAIRACNRWMSNLTQKPASADSAPASEGVSCSGSPTNGASGRPKAKTGCGSKTVLVLGHADPQVLQLLRSQGFTVEHHPERKRPF
mmetsp:Transcript_55777/g.129912  ORF Transcript_55777/g.129912 Transcript_55777/m.129912 type:complete len:106 (+) Transcript_55777:71-388(+)